MASVALGQSGGTLDELSDNARASQEADVPTQRDSGPPRGQIPDAPASGGAATPVAALDGPEDAAAADARAEEDRLEARLSELRDQAASAEARLADLGQQVSELEQQVAGLTAQRDAAKAEIAALQSRRTEAEAALAQTQQQDAELRQGLEEATTRRTAAEADALDAERRQAEAEQGFAAAQELRALAEAALVEAVAELDQLTAASGSEGQGAPQLTTEGPPQDAEPSPSEEPSTASTAPAAPSRRRWSATEVDEALSRAPALGTGPQRAELRRRLMQGECPPAALKGAYNQINRQTLLALVAELGACS